MDINDTLSAQVAVLGSMLISHELVGEVLSKVRDRDFISPKCRMVFQAIRHVFTQGERPDPVLVVNRLGGTPADGWGQYVHELMELTPTAQNIWEYVPVMQEQAKLVRLRELGGRLQSCADMDSARDFLAKGQELICNRPEVNIMDMEQGLMDFYERHREKHQYYSWPLERLNEGLFVEGGDYVVIGGYPSAGKTALALLFAWHMAQDKKVGFFSLETNDRKLHDRIVAANAKLDFSKIKRGELTQDDYNALAMMSQKLTKPRLELIEATGMTVSDIQAITLSKRYDIIFVDYLQLIAPERRTQNRENEVASISRGLQGLARKNGVMVCALSQLSRPEKAGENRKEPTMTSFRESGQIEQDADVAMLLFLEEYNNPKSRRILNIGKNKEGERARMYLAFDGGLQSFRMSAMDAPAPQKQQQAAYKQTTIGELPDPDPEDLPF